MIYLACKVTESLRSMRDAFNILSVLKDPDVSLTVLEHEYIKSKPRIIEGEHQLLRILRFDVEIDSPYKYMLNIAR